MGDKPGSVITMKVDNRYRAGRVVKKDGVLRGNKETMRITEVPNPSNPLQPILMVGETLAKHLSAHPIKHPSKTNDGGNHGD